jgi:hypothetical protein
MRWYLFDSLAVYSGHRSRALRARLVGALRCLGVGEKVMSISDECLTEQAWVSVYSSVSGIAVSNVIWQVRTSRKSHHRLPRNGEALGLPCFALPSLLLYALPVSVLQSHIR